ncbi:vesicle coat protein [Peziza echinospora]|nr:vesicle coat protein [Peziza echinospora]
MNFMVSLAHFCEVHGPTSILCTQVIPPECQICDPVPYNNGSSSNVDLGRPASTPTPPAEELHPNGLLVPQSGTPQTSAARGSRGPSLNPPPPFLSSPAETPPASPRSPVMASSSLPSSVSGPGIGTSGIAGISVGPSSPTAAETCRNCSFSLPRAVTERIQESAPDSSPNMTGKPQPKPVPPTLRTRETISVLSMGEVGQFGAGWLEDTLRERPRRHPIPPRLETINSDRLHPSGASSAPQPSIANLPPRSSASSALSTEDDDDEYAVETDTEPSDETSRDTPKYHLTIGSPTHNHHITYLSTRAPSTPSRFSALRQSCIRTLSCELLPACTGPVSFGDTIAGFTIAYVFRIADPRARGGKRSYAFLCICPEERVVFKSFGHVVGVFHGLVQRIKGFANLKNSRDQQAANRAANNNMPITSSPVTLGGRVSGLTGPEGFLRRREGVGSAKGLAELVGKDDLFVEIHACFVRLLGDLVKRYGYFHGRLAPGDHFSIGQSMLGETVSNLDRVRSRSMATSGDKARLVVGGVARAKQRSLSTDGGRRESIGHGHGIEAAS